MFTVCIHCRWYCLCYHTKSGKLQPLEMLRTTSKRLVLASVVLVLLSTLISAAPLSKSKCTQWLYNDGLTFSGWSEISWRQWLLNHDFFISILGVRVYSWGYIREFTCTSGCNTRPSPASIYPISARLTSIIYVNVADVSLVFQAI